MKIAVIVGKLPAGGVNIYINELVRSIEEEFSYTVDKYIYNTSCLTKKDIEKSKVNNWIIYNNEDQGNTLNEYDMVFALYHVCYKQVNPEEIDAYIDLLKNKITTKKAIFFNEHNPSSIKRNYGLDYICRKDVLLSFDYIMQFDYTVSSALLIRSIIGDEEYNKRYVQLLLPYHFDDNIKWGTPEDRIRSIEYLGRFVLIKDQQRLIRAKEYFDRNNYIIEMRGLIRMISLIGVPDLCYKFVNDEATKEPTEKCFWVNKTWLKNNNFTDQGEAINYPVANRDNKIFIYGEYDYRTIYNNVKNSAFACDFLNLKKVIDYGKQTIEYAMCEFVNNGIIILMDKSLGTHSYLLNNAEVSDTNFIDANMGLFLEKDLSNIEEVIEKMNYLYENPDEYEKFRMNAYNLWKQHTDPKAIVTKLFNDINSK